MQNGSTSPKPPTAASTDNTVRGRSLRRAQLLPLVAAMAITTLLVSGIYIWSAYRREMRDLETIRQDQLEARKQELKDNVGLVHTTARAQLADAGDWDAIRQSYGPDLMHVIDACEQVIAGLKQQAETGQLHQGLNAESHQETNKAYALPAGRRQPVC